MEIPFKYPSSLFILELQKVQINVEYFEKRNL